MSGSTSLLLIVVGVFLVARTVTKDAEGKTLSDRILGNRDGGGGGGGGGKGADAKVWLGVAGTKPARGIVGGKPGLGVAGKTPATGVAGPALGGILGLLP